MVAHKFILEDNWDGGKTLYHSGQGLLKPIAGFYHQLPTEENINRAIKMYMEKEDIVSGTIEIERES